MFPMTITIANTAQLNAVMAALNIDAQEPVATKEVAAAPAPKQKATPAKTESPAPTPRTAEAVADAAPEKKAESLPSRTTPPADAPAASPAANAPTYQDAAAAITKLSRTKGRDAAVAILTEFGAAKLPDVKPEQFADVIAAAEAAMGA